VLAAKTAAGAAAASKAGVCWTCESAIAPTAVSLECPEGAHTMCADCTRGFLEAEAEPVKMHQHRGALKCLAPGCPSPAWPQRELLELPGGLGVGFAAVLQRMADLQQRTQAAPPLTKFAQSLAASLAARPDDAKGAQEIVAVLRQQIEGRVLCLACPRCSLIFLDHEGCDALTCSQCGARFCAVCLADCGDTMDKAHAHVNQTHGQLWSSAEQRAAAHRVRRIAEIRRLLQDGGLDPEASKVPAATKVLREAVLAACERSLRDVGIAAGDV
jgi:hypothetical protein